MKSFAFFSPIAGVGRTTLVFNLGRVLADAGFEVLMLDLDPQASLTERAGGIMDGPGTAWDALAGVVEGQLDPSPPAPMLLGANLSLVRGSVMLATLDDELARTTADDRHRRLVGSIEHLLRGTAEELGADVVLCDLGPNLGPLNRTVVEMSDDVILVLDPGRPAGGSATDRVLRRWQSRPKGQAIVPLGFVQVGGSSSTPEMLIGDLEHLGTVQRYPGVISIEHIAHKPAVELTAADGAMGAHLYAVRDLRAQLESLATAIIRAGGLVDDEMFTDPLVEDLGQELTEALCNDLPSTLDGLSSRTTIDLVEDVRLVTVNVRRNGLRVSGSASVSVDLEWGGGERRDGVETSMSFPLRFDVDLDRSHEIAEVHDLEVDTSSLHE